MAFVTFKSLQQFGQFLGNWLVQGGQLVDQNVANARAAICSPCHNNRRDTTGGCGSCNKSANAILNAVRGKIIKGRSTPMDSQLFSCKICGCDLKTMVHIPNEALINKQDANAFPSFCWKKKILEDAQI